MLHHLLTQAMEQRGLDQAGVARAVGVSHVTVYRWIAEGSVPRSDVLVAVARALDLPIEQVLTAAEATIADRRRRREPEDIEDELAGLRAERESLISEIAALRAQRSADA